MNRPLQTVPRVYRFDVLMFIGFTALGATALAAETAMTPPVVELPGAKSHIFKEVTGGALRLFIFTPPDHKPADARPALVLFFGGGWERGTPSQFVRQAEYLTSRDMVVVLPEYRTRTSHNTTPFECVADSKSAIRWVRGRAAELGIDPKRIAAGGGSAGGHVAAATAVLKDVEEADADTRISCVPNALVLFNPVLDTTESGYGAKKLGKRARELSPMHHLRAELPPTVVFHGKADKTVPFENAERFTAEMKKAGNTCTLHAFDGQGHGFYRQEPFYDDVVSRLDQFLTDLGWLAAKPK